MHSYSLPPLGKVNDEEGMAFSDGMEESIYPDRYDRKITIPIDDQLLAELEIGGETELVLTGRVIELTDNRSEQGAGRKSVQIELERVKAGMTQLSDDEMFEEGFRSRRGPRINQYRGI